MRVFVSRKYRFGFFPIPKCGSTTMIALMARMHGVVYQKNVRDSFEMRAYSDAEKGSEEPVSFYLVDEADVERFRSEFAGYEWAAFVRNPYSRLYSNYSNKLNRYARKFEPAIYLRAKFAKLMAIMTGRDQDAAQDSALRSRISLDDFLAGLEEHGVGWDRHYMPQAEFIDEAVFADTHLIRMENMADEVEAFIRGVCAEHGVLDEIFPLERHNASGGNSAVLSRPQKDAIAGLYRHDFERFGYER